MEQTQKREEPYKLTPEHVANLYHQPYLRKAKKEKKFATLEHSLQRAVIETALLETEAMKLSRTYGEDARANETAYFEKYLEFYAHQAARDPDRFYERESRFLETHATQKSRDTAREVEIRDRARRIDAAQAGQEINKINLIKSGMER